MRFPAALATTEHLRARVSEMKQDTGLWQEGMVCEASARQKCHGIAEELMGEILQVKSDACEALQALGMMWAIVVRIAQGVGHLSFLYSNSTALTIPCTILSGHFHALRRNRHV